MERIKTIRSHKGFGDWLAEVEEEPMGYIPRQDNIPSPYSSCSTHIVYDWNGKRVIAVETDHKVYEIFAVPEGIEIVQGEEVLLG